MDSGRLMLIDDAGRSGGRQLFAMLCAFLLPNTGWAHDPVESLYDLPLEDLTEVSVVTTSRYAQKLFDAPGVVSVVTADQIAQYGANNLVEVLQRMPSVAPLTGYVFQDNAMSVRGDLPNQNDTHLLVLVNGRPFRSGYSGSFSGVLFHRFPVEAIARLEFIRGPGSVLYGSNAYTGVLNIITRQPADDSRGIALKAGSFETRQASGFGSFHHDDLSVRAHATVLDEGGWRGEMVDELGVSSGDDFGEEHYSLMASGEWRNFTADIFLANGEEDHFGPVPRWPAQTIDRDSYLLGLGHRYAINDRWLLNTNLTYTESSQNYPQANPSGFDWEFDAHSDELTLESYATGSIATDHTLLLGASVTRLQGNIGGGQVTLPHYDLIWTSLYAQFDYQFNPALRVFAGGQWNKAEGIDAELVPRLGVIHRFTPTKGVKVLYSEAFRSPFPVETDVQALPVLQGNPDLEPESVKTLDLQAFHDSGSYQVSLTYFRTEQEDLVQRTAGGIGMPGTFENLGERKIQGLELEWLLKPSPYWEFTGSVLHQINEDNNGNADVTLAPDNLVKFGAVYKPSHGFSLGLFDSWSSHYKDTRNIQPGSVPVNPRAGGDHLLSLNALIRPGHWLPGRAWKDTSVSLYGTNLLDEEIYTPEYSRNLINTVPGGAGRGYFLTVTLGLD